MVKKALLTGLALLLTSGCVSKDYVKEQVDLVRQESETKILQLENDLVQYKQKFASCFDSKYDYDKRCVDYTNLDLESITDAVHEIMIGEPVVNKEGVLTEFNAYFAGTGIYLDNGYVLTAKHVVRARFLDVSSFKLSGPKKSGSHLGGDFMVKKKDPKKLDKKKEGLKKSNELVMIIGDKENIAYLEVVKESKNYDLALLKIKGKHNLKSYGFKLGKANELQKGHFLYFVGNSLGFGVNLGESSFAKSKNMFDNTVFDLDRKLAHGDSGGAVIGFRDGQPELLGIIKLTSQSNGGITRIEYALEEFKEYLEK